MSVSVGEMDLEARGSMRSALGVTGDLSSP